MRGKIPKHSNGNARHAQSRWLLPAFGLAAMIAAAMIFLLLDPFSETGEGSRGLEGIQDGAGSEPVPAPVTDADVSEGHRARVLPGEGSGGAVRISGILTADGVPLSGVKVLAFSDRAREIPPVMRQRMQSSILYYGPAAAELRSLARELGLLGGEGGKASGPAPAASAETGTDGRFTLAVPRSQTLSFGLDHDFYFLPAYAEGPYDWPGETAVPPDFGGRLDAELGSAVEGTVTDLDDYPIEGAEVFLGVENALGFMGGGRFPGGRPGREAAGFKTRTDDQGGFFFRGVPAREGYVLEVRKEGYAPVRTEPFETRAGEMHGARIRLGEGTTFRVRVRDSKGAPVAGAEVFVLKERGGGESGRSGRGPGRGGPGFMFNGPEVAGHGETGKDGIWLCRAVPVGRYLVRAGYPGRLEAETPDPIQVTERPRVVPVELTLERGLSIAGRVVDDRNRPVAGAEVLARRHTDRGDFFGRMRASMEPLSVPESMQKKARTNDRGAFVITGLAEGKTYDVAAGRKGFMPAAQEKKLPGETDVLLVLDRPGVVEGKVISAVTADPVNRFTLRIVPAPEDRGRGGRRGGMQGMLDRFRRDRGGRGGPPFMGRDRGGRGGDPFREFFSRMMEVLQEKDYFSPPRLTDREESFADKEGRFEFDEIVPGRYRLLASAEGYAPMLSDPVEVKKGERVTNLVLGLGPGASVEGIVLSDAGPVAGAAVRMEADRDASRDLGLLLDTVKEKLSGPEGRFSIKNLPAGTFRVRAEHRDHPSVRSDPMELTEGRAVTGLVLRFPPGARIIGTVLDEEGKPLAGQVVTCRESSGRWGRERGRDTTDDQGRFEIKGLREGTFQVSLRTGFRGFGAPPGAGGSVEVTVAAGQTQEVLLTRTPPEGAVVYGVVSDGTELLTAGFITVTSMERQRGRGSFRSSGIGPDGHYRVEGVQPGRNRFTLRFPYGDTFENTTMEFDIPDQREVLQDIYLPGGRIAGVVTDGATGQPLAGVRVSLTSEGEAQPPSSRGRRRGPFGRSGGNSRTTGEDGTFLFRFLEAGTYDLEARPGRGFEGNLDTGYYPARLSDLVLAANQAREGVRLVLAAGGGITVRAYDMNGAPVQNASVTATEENPGEGAAPARMRGRTDEDGTAELNGMKPGSYTLWVQSRSAGEKALGGVLVSPGRFTPVNVTLEKGFTVRVRLRDKQGKAVSGASLTLRNSQGALIPVPGGGRFGGGGGSTYNLGRIPAGMYTLEARWKGKTGTGTFSVSASGTLTVKIL